MARALTERDQAMELRALSLAEEAIARRETWVRPLGDAPSGVVKQERWLRAVSTIAAYRDRWKVEGQRPLGAVPDRENKEQSTQRRRAIAAAKRANAISRAWARRVSRSFAGRRWMLERRRGLNSKETGSDANRSYAPYESMGILLWRS